MSNIYSRIPPAPKFNGTHLLWPVSCSFSMTRMHWGKQSLLWLTTDYIPLSTLVYYMPPRHFSLSLQEKGGRILWIILLFLTWEKIRNFPFLGTLMMEVQTDFIMPNKQSFCPSPSSLPSLSLSLRYNSHGIKYTLLKCTVQWFFQDIHKIVR